MNKKLFSVLIIIVINLIFTGCSNSLERKIIGQWESQQAEVVLGEVYNSNVLEAREIIFNHDGIIDINGETFKYTWIDNKHIQIQDENNEIFKVIISNKSLSLKHEGSTTNESYEVVFTKAKL